jgi:hypothetical protein
MRRPVKGASCRRGSRASTFPRPRTIGFAIAPCIRCEHFLPADVKFEHDIARLAPETVGKKAMEFGADLFVAGPCSQRAISLSCFEFNAWHPAESNAFFIPDRTVEA